RPAAPGARSFRRRRGNPLQSPGAGARAGRSCFMTTPLSRHARLLAVDPRGEASGHAPLVSFEFFPPKTEEAEGKLWLTVKPLEPLAPRFVSVIYGAGGSTRERTHATVCRIRGETPLEPAAHLTCVGASRGEIDEVARRYWEAGIRHIVAL